MESVKFVREYYTYDFDTRTKKLDSRWHYDFKKFRNGPILVEDFSSPDKEKRKTKSKGKAN